MTDVTKPALLKLWAATGDIVQPIDSKIEEGWIAEKPPFQNENWIQNRTDTYLKHIDENGIPEWLATSEYRLGSLCLYLAQEWVSLAAGNVGNVPSTGPGFWELKDYVKRDGSVIMDGDLKTVNARGIKTEDTLGTLQTVAVWDGANVVWLGAVTDSNGLNAQVVIRQGGANRIVINPATLTYNGFNVWHSGNLTPVGSALTTTYLGGLAFSPTNVINVNFLPVGWSVSYNSGTDEITITHNLGTIEGIGYWESSVFGPGVIQSFLPANANSFILPHPGNNNTTVNFSVTYNN